jgi:Ulp1 family protease
MQVFIPINIENFQWYLAVVNAKKVRYMYSILWDHK